MHFYQTKKEECVVVNVRIFRLLHVTPGSGQDGQDECLRRQPPAGQAGE